MANTANSSTLTTDFNVNPYYDDYDAQKSFHRILFKPGYAVQARELTQIQTILQNQISRFGKHVFREGSIVLPGQFGIEQSVDYVKIMDNDPVTNTEITMANIKDINVRGATNGITAYVIDVADGNEASSNTKTLFVRYLDSSSSNSSIKTFVENETLTSNVATLKVISSAATGKGSRFFISEGVMYAKEHFIQFPSQSIILSRYETTPTCRVGFFIYENIIKYTDDSSLLDPALESSNYSAPGADRLQLDPQLKVLSIDDQTAAPNFVELFTIENGIVLEKYDRSQYNILRDELAKRTMDESGDYYVKGLNVRVRENLDTGDNDGYSNTGNSMLLSVGVEPGVGYVKGYEVGKLVTTYVTTEKSTTSVNVSSQKASAGYGNYLPVNELTGSLKHDQGTQVVLYDTANKALTNKLWASGGAVGNSIGTAKVFTIEYDSGTLGTPSGNALVYISDIRMNGTNSFSNTRSIVATNFRADVVLTSNSAALKETAAGPLLFPVGSDAVRTLRDTSGNPALDFNFKRTTENFSILSSGQFSIQTTLGDELFIYNGSLTNADKREIILTINENANIAGGGTVSANSGNGNTKTLTGLSTYFTRLNAGDKIEIAGKANTFFIDFITSDNSLNTTETLPTGLSGNSYFKVYKAGDVIDLTTKGFDAGDERTVTATTTDMTFDLKETLPTDKLGSITYQLNKTGAKEVAKNLRSYRYVIINCATAGTSGPFCLGVPDLYKVRKIIKKTGSAPTGTSDGTDVTSYFDVDNGQRDSHYDLASITPNISLGGTDYLLVEFDYFYPSFTQGKGYFSVDSYNANDSIAVSNTSIRTENIPIFVSPVTKYEYDLRNYVDFRPVKAITATDTTTVASATTNPSNTSAFYYETNGLRLPVPSSQYSYSYSYYLARKDLVVIDKDGNVSIVRGGPDSYPRTPITPDNVMALASIVIPPYPSLSPTYGQKINRRDLACTTVKLSNIRFTMRDIGVLKNRIVNLEYYASLNLLEKSAVDMQIVDENGLNRFKNGIFVDTFSDHNQGDNNDIDYRIVVDPIEKSIRPIYTMHSYYYDFVANSSIVKTGDLVTLPYTHAALISQPSVTSFRNVELTSYRFIGRLFLTPDTDVWVDTVTLPENNITMGPDANNIPQGTTTEWGAWQTTVTGYTVDPAATGNAPGRTYIDPAKLAGYKTKIKPTNIISNPNSPRDQRVTETSVKSRTGVETTTSLNESTVSLGDRVVDVALIPYIREQTIHLNAKGLKANTQLYAFFDGEAMSSYCRPIFTPPVYDGDGKMRPLVIAPYLPEGAPLTTNATGEIRATMRLPAEKKFRVGTREVVLTDSPTNSALDASTYSKAYFVAEGIVQQKQNTILTTRTVVQTQKNVSESITQTKVIGYIDNPSCIAYSFIPKGPVDEEGMFITKIDIYLAKKHPTLGIWVEIREMDSSGGITRNQVPFSEVWIPSSDLIVSEDASLPHTITFPSPVFVYNDTQYAFVIHTIGLNPDTYIWISRLGEIDKKTGNATNSRPLRGTFYTTNNNLNWDIVPDVDLTCTIYRADFTTGVVGTAVIGNKPFETVVFGNTTSGFANTGDTIVGNYRMLLSGNTGSISVGDYLIGANSTANANVISISGSTVTVANIFYQVGETLDIRYGSNLASKGLTTVISSITSSSGIITSGMRNLDGEKVVDISSSNGNFIIGETVTDQSNGSKATIDRIENRRYSVVDFEPSYLDFRKTEIGFEMQTTSNTGIQRAYERIVENKNIYFTEEKAILSRSNEVLNIGGGNSNNVRISMLSTSSYLSPVVDLGRSHTVYVDSFINANTTNETLPSRGALINKYISLPVTLAEGQDAEDLMVIITAYRPPTTDVKIWVKILHAEDSEVFATTNWIELEKMDDTRFSSLADRDDFKEFTYKFPASMLTGPNGEVQYTNRNGITFSGYKYYRLKIGLTGENSAVVPRVADLRAIALQI